MDEDQILQSIIADPDLVDPSIDVSRLRKTTETDPRLLGGVSGIEGLRFDPTRTDYIRNLYSVYGGGLPTIDVAPEIVEPVIDTTPVVDAGGGGGDIDPATSGVDTILDTGDAPINVDTPLTQMITTPTGDTMTVKEAMTSDDAYSLDTPSFDDQYESIEDIGTPINIGFGEGQVDPGLAAGLEGPIVDTSPLIDTVNYSEFDDLEADIGAQPTELGSRINQAFENVKNQGVGAVGSFKDSLVELGGKVKEGFDNVIEFGDTSIDVGKSLASGAISFIGKGLTGIPGLGLIAGMLPEGGPTLQTEKADSIGLLNENATAGYQDIYGINTQSQFGDYDQYNIDRVAELEDIVADQKARKLTDTLQMKELKDRKEYNKISGVGGDIDDDSTGDAQIATETIGTLPEITEARQEQGEYIQEIEAQPTVNTTTQSGRDEADRQQRDTGVATVQTNQGTRYETSSGDRYASAAEAAEKGDGGGGRGGKIVCTMMNDSYGFGSFRNKIWLKHSKDLAPEYQIGYHKIFLPLVKLSKTNKVLKKTLEHIAVHRTIDIRQEARGKMHLLGRVYRKILEPICYIVGKHAKR